MDTMRIAERLSEGGVFTENQAKRIATTLADHLKDELATKRDLDVLEARLRAEFQSGIASVRNQLLTAQVAAFFGIILVQALTLGAEDGDIGGRIIGTPEQVADFSSSYPAA